MDNSICGNERGIGTCGGVQAVSFFYQSNGSNSDTHHRVNNAREFEIVRAISSSHRALKPLFQRYQNDGNIMYLEPSPLTNSAFSSLVAHSTEIVGKKTIEGIASKISDEVKTEIRQMCHVGESALERFYATKILDWLDRDFEAALKTITSKVNSRLKGQFSQSELIEGNSSVERAHRIETLRALLSPPHYEFPYIDNYLVMVAQGEFALLRSLVSQLEQSTLRVALVGSGALDLTSDIFLIEGNSNGFPLSFISIDRDPKCVELSQRLLEYKERLGILSKGQKKILLADASKLSYTGGISDKNVENNNIVTVDVVFLAAMLSNQVCQEILESTSNLPMPVQGVMVRDGVGLVGELLYARRDLQKFAHYGYPLLSLAIPEHQVANGYLEDLVTSNHIVVPRIVVNNTWTGLYSH
jgi:Nicotianamine synthase protein